MVDIGNLNLINVHLCLPTLSCGRLFLESPFTWDIFLFVVFEKFHTNIELLWKMEPSFKREDISVHLRH